MSLTPETADAVSRLSAFALFVLITGIAGIGFYRRWWVFGWFFLQERDGRLTAETQASRNADALEANTNALAQVGDAIQSQAADLAAIRRELRELRNERRRSLSAKARDHA